MNLAWENDAVRQLEDEIRCAGQTDANVMLAGESGVGKRFTASMIHRSSDRRRAPFVAINASTVWDTGACTAGDPTDQAIQGLLEAAEGGTLFIQDIEKIPASGQLQLFRFLDWGTSAGRRVRFMTATGTDLFGLVRAGKFREDLYYRLNVFCFVIPPLRERREDIPLMFHHYLSMHTTEVPPLSNAALQRLVEYPWPGNIRELRTLTRRLSAQRLPDVIEPEHLPGPIGHRPSHFRELLPSSI